MSTTCALCDRVLDASADGCACGASTAWLAQAPAALRGRLRRRVRASVGAATAATLVGCVACAAYPADAGHDAQGHDAAAVDTGDAP